MAYRADVLLVDAYSYTGCRRKYRCPHHACDERRSLDQQSRVPMRRPAKSSAGFTLVELLVVMGIMGLVLGAVLTARPKAVAARVAVAARAVAATLQLARAGAMTSNAETVFRVDAQKGR